MKMQERFSAYIRNHCLVDPGDKILICLSGGIDSMVMAHLMLQEKISMAVAHVNYRLRGSESDEDEDFVREWALRNHTDFFVLRPEMNNIHGKSIQMAAREIRHAWFEEISEQEQCKHIALGHHLNDSAETFFIHFLRGTGIAGLQGIPFRNGKAIRPLMFATRHEIMDYAERHGILFCEDSSNEKDQYLRNRIRHHVMPVLETVQPSFMKTAEENMQRFSEAAAFIRITLSQAFKALSHTEGERLTMPLDAIVYYWSKYPGLEVMIMHEWLKSYGFSGDVTREIVRSVQSGTAGSTFRSGTHVLYREQTDLVIVPAGHVASLEDMEWAVGEDAGDYPVASFIVSIAYTETPVTDFGSQGHTGWFDADSLVFPLVFRKWRAGDSFVPLGMNGKKKVSDFLTDRKIGISKKAEILVMQSGSEISWILGLRTDDRFKVHAETKKVCRISLTRNNALS